MNIKRNNLLHYLLVILMMFAPVRSVMAMQSSHCDMDDEMSKVVLSDAHALHVVSVVTMPYVVNQNIEMNHDCCCCDNGCTGDCDMSIAASLVMQSSFYGAVYKNISESNIIATNVLVRALIPPSRPPAILYN